MKTSLARPSLWVGLALLLFTACQQEGPAERAGKEVDKKADQAAEAVKEGAEKVEETAEKAAEKAKEGAEATGEAAKKAAEDVKEATR